MHHIHVNKLGLRVIDMEVFEEPLLNIIQKNYDEKLEKKFGLYQGN